MSGDNGTKSFSATLETAGTRSITATDTVTASIHGSQTGITVNPAALASITVSPAESTISAGTTETYSAEGFDTYGNSKGDVTGDTTFSILPDGSCTTTDCGSQTAGAHTVTGTDGTFSDDATLHVAGLASVDGGGGIAELLAVTTRMTVRAQFTGLSPV